MTAILDKLGNMVRRVGRNNVMSLVLMLASLSTNLTGLTNNGYSLINPSGAITLCGP